MRQRHAWTSILLLAFALSSSAAFGQVEGPIVGKAVRSDASKPLRELSEEAKRQEPADETDQAIGSFSRRSTPDRSPTVD